MSYFNVFFQAAVCHSWFPAAKLRLKKQSYGNNCDRRILKKHKKVWCLGLQPDAVFPDAFSHHLLWNEYPEGIDDGVQHPLTDVILPDIERYAPLPPSQNCESG